MKFPHKLILLAAVVATFAWFVWPTPYRYTNPVYEGDGVVGFYRTSRVTGRVQVYVPEFREHWSNPGSAQGRWVWGWTDR